MTNNVINIHSLLYVTFISVIMQTVAV